MQVVHYDRLKRYHGPIPVASNVQTRPTTHTTGYQTSPVPDFDHSQCGQTFLPFSFAPQLTSLNPGNRPTSPHPSPPPIADHFPNRSPPPLLSSARRRSLPSPTRSYDHERHTPHHLFQWSPVQVQLLENFSLPARFLRKQLSFSFPYNLILSSMVLLTIFVSDSILHHSRTALQHSAPLWTTHLTFMLLLPLTLRPHPDLCVVPPNSNVKRNHYSKPNFIETSRNFCLLRRSPATTASCEITNIPWPLPKLSFNQSSFSQSFTFPCLV